MQGFLALSRSLTAKDRLRLSRWFLAPSERLCTSRAQVRHVGNEGLLPILVAGFSLLQPRPTFVWQGLFLSVEMLSCHRKILFTRAGFQISRRRGGLRPRARGDLGMPPPKALPGSLLSHLRSASHLEPQPLAPVLPGAAPSAYTLIGQRLETHSWATKKF